MIYSLYRLRCLIFPPLLNSACCLSIRPYQIINVTTFSPFISRCYSTFLFILYTTFVYNVDQNSFITSSFKNFQHTYVCVKDHALHPQVVWLWFYKFWVGPVNRVYLRTGTYLHTRAHAFRHALTQLLHVCIQLLCGFWTRDLVHIIHGFNSNIHRNHFYCS